MIGMSDSGALELEDARVLCARDTIADLHVEPRVGVADRHVFQRDAMTKPAIDRLCEARLGDTSKNIVGRFENEFAHATTELRQKKPFAWIREHELKQLIAHVRR